MPNRNSSLWWMLLLCLLGAAATMWPGAVAGAATAGATSESAGSVLTWSTLSPPSSPPPLVNGSAAYDADNGTLVVFGGQTINGSLSDNTWVWDGTTWLDYPPAAAGSPAPRELASMAFDPLMHQLILFGGEGADGRLLDDTWAWNGLSWYEVTGTAFGSAPSPREGAAMTFSPGGALVLFGGRGVPEAQPGLGGTSSATSATTPPTTLVPSTSTTLAPTVSEARPLSDTWLWTTTGWIASRAVGPSEREEASMAYDGNRNETVLFGGQSAGGVLSDTWIWNGSTWRRAATTTTSSSSSQPGTTTKATAPVRTPAGRYSADLVYDPDVGDLVLSGGMGAHALLSDAWEWNGAEWAGVKPGGAAPSAAGSAAAFDSASDQLVVFGGRGASGEPLASTVILSKSAPVSLGTAPSMSTTTTPGSPASAVTVPGQGNVSPSGAVGPAGGTGTSSTRPPVSASSSILHRGWLVTLSGSGFKPDADVLITFHSSPVLVGRTNANATGAFSVTVAVPDNASAGTHHFVATGTGRSGRPTQLAVAVRIIGSGLASASNLVKGVLIAAALLFPLATWMFLDALGWWRRRQRVRVG